jgi:hypothetical protein
MSSSARGRELRRDIATELDRLGIVKPKFGITGGSHQYVQFDHGGRSHRYTFSLTPSVRCAGRKTISGLRRLIRGRR